MGLFGPDPPEWHVLAHRLGLVPWRRTAGFGHGASFKQVKRSLGVPADPNAASFTDYLHGTFNGAEVVVYTYDVGSGSSQTTYTGFLARVDPPLFMGLGARKRGFADKLFGKPTILLGPPPLDEIQATAFEEARLRTLFAPHHPEGAASLDAIVRLLGYELAVSDSVVALAESGTLVDPARVAWYLRMATDLAQRLARRGREMPRGPAERAHQAEWAEFARSRSLAFDVERMQITGRVADCAMEIALETEGQEVRTSITARFPSTVPVAFTVQRTDTAGFLQGLFSQDIQIGHGEVDQHYQIWGHPEAHVRALLRKPELLDLLVRLGRITREIQLHQGGLFYRVPGSSPSTDHLGYHVDALRAASEAFFGAAKQLGPYR